MVCKEVCVFMAKWWIVHKMSSQYNQNYTNVGQQVTFLKSGTRSIIILHIYIYSIKKHTMSLLSFSRHNSAPSLLNFKPRFQPSGFPALHAAVRSSFPLPAKCAQIWGEMIHVLTARWWTPAKTASDLTVHTLELAAHTGPKTGGGRSWQKLNLS